MAMSSDIKVILFSILLIIIFFVTGCKAACGGKYNASCVVAYLLEIQSHILVCRASLLVMFLEFKDYLNCASCLFFCA